MRREVKVIQKLDSIIDESGLWVRSAAKLVDFLI